MILDTKNNITMDKSGILETFSKGLNKYKACISSKIDIIISKSIYSHTTSDLNDKNNILYHHYYSIIYIVDKLCLIDIVIRSFPHDKTIKDKFYYMGINFIENKTDVSPLPH